jgi:hypothetical protein
VSLVVDYVCQNTRGSLHSHPNKTHYTNERTRQGLNTTSSHTAFIFSFAYTFAAYQMSSSLASTQTLASLPQHSPARCVTQDSAPPLAMAIPTAASAGGEVHIDRVDEFIEVFFTLVSLLPLPSNLLLVKVSSTL